MSKTLPELKADLKKAQNQLAAAGDNDEKLFVQKKIDRLEAEIKVAEEKGSAPATPAKKPSKKKAEKKSSAKKHTPAKPKKTAKMIIIGGKEYAEGSPEHCKALKDAFDDRKKQREKAARKTKTKSISFKVADAVVGGVEKAISNIAAADIADDPKKFVAKLTHVQTATEKFLRELKDILGEDYSASEMKRPLSAINTAIERIKHKYKRR